MPNLSQPKMLALFRPLMESEGVLFSKKKNVFAKKAEGGEPVVTMTDDGLETVNTAQKGSYLVKNQTEAAEVYVVEKAAFEKRYERKGPADDGFEEYHPTGKVIAVELTPERQEALDLPASFHFKAAWKEDMIAKKGDYIVCPPDFSEIYRIARKEFFETYKPAEV